MNVETLKLHKLPGGNKIPVELVQISDGTANSEIH
jgi:hypothetical protein